MRRLQKIYFIKNVLSFHKGINLIAGESSTQKENINYLQLFKILNINPAKADYIFSCSPDNWWICSEGRSRSL